MPKPIEDYIDGLERWQQEIVNLVRQAVHAADANIEEEIKWGSIAFSHIKTFAGFKISKNHISLVFFEGQRLQDPHNKLETGSDSKVASLKWKEGDEIDKKYITYLSKQSIRL